MMAQARQVYPELSVRRLSALLGVGRSWYYERPERPARAERDVSLRNAIERIVLEFPGYGYRRVTKTLQRGGWTANHKRVLRVMRQQALLCQLKRRFIVTTNSRHALRIYPNLAAELTPTGPDQLWVADITYIRLPTAFVYLACILDAWSRRCVGWELSRSIDARLTLAALDRAVATRDPAPGLIHHSDRGVQYSSGDYVARLDGIGARISMAATGNPYENAKAESFFKTLKWEEVYLQEYRTLEEAEANIGRFIADVYNTKRLHSSLGYRPPAEFEAAHLAAAPWGRLAMKYVRLYADAAGESHFEDRAATLASVDFAPPAPPLDVSAPEAASRFLFLSAPVDWAGEWHSVPRRQWMLYLAGEIEVEASDGEVRRFGPGSVTLVEDTMGTGHRSRVVGETAALMAVVQLPD